MGEIIFSLFVGGYLIATGFFMNWYLKKEMNSFNEAQKASGEGVEK